MLVTSRSYAEYQAMFALDEQVLGGRILDCCAGSSSFIAELADRGGHGMAVDPAYARPVAELIAMRDAGNLGGDQILSEHESHFTWAWYGSPARRQGMRRAAADRFAADFSRRRHAYVAGELPHLPFRDGAFDLVLCSHLLFTWSSSADHGTPATPVSADPGTPATPVSADPGTPATPVSADPGTPAGGNIYDAGWHYAAITELLRVSRGEVRVFPLVMRGAGDRVRFLDDVMERVTDDGHHAELRRVPFEFQRGADTMLVARAVP